MAFPEDPLGVQAALRLGAGWVDITATKEALTRDPIKVGAGRRGSSAVADPSTCTLLIDNKGGKYSPRNPSSPHFGVLGRNTPVRISVRAGTPALELTGALFSHASTPDTAALDITGDIDVRADLTLDNWSRPSSGVAGTVELVAKLGFASGSKSWLLASRNGGIYFEWSPNGTATGTIQTGLIAVPPSGRLAVRATLDVDNGAGGHTVRAYTAPTMAGPWTQVASATGAGTTSIHNSATALKIGDATDIGFMRPVGRCHAVQVRNGIDGTLVADANFSERAPGTTSFTDSATRVWTIAGTAVTNRRTRFLGEVSRWPIRWEPGEHSVWTSIEGGGLLRRLNQGTKALASTLARRVPAGKPSAYWPMEEQAGASRAYSPIAGVRTLTATGLTYAADDSLSGASALPQLASAASLSAPVPTSTSTTGWHVECVYRLESLPPTSQQVLRVNVGGAGTGAMAYAVALASAAGIRVEIRDADGDVLAASTLATAEALAAFVGSWNRLQIYTATSGGSTYVAVSWRDVVANTYWYVRTLYTGNPGRVTSVSGQWAAAFDRMGLGHLAVWNGVTGTVSPAAPGVTTYESADDGFRGESTIDRMRRVSAEEGLPLAVHDGDLTLASEAVGPQRPAPILGVLAQAAEADGGILYEQNRDVLGLAYRDRATMYSQAPALVLDYAAGEVAPPLEPEEDDQALRNDVTVTRDGGSSGRAVLDTGPLSVQDPPDGVGRYDESVTLGLASDDQVLPHAHWRLHHGSWDEARYPTVRVELHKNPHLIDQILDMVPGDRVQLVNTPSFLPPGPIDLIAQGWEETFTPRTWSIEFTCTPAGPWQTAALEGVGERVDTDLSTLAAAVTATATALSVRTPTGPLWVQAVPPLNANASFDEDLDGWSGVGAAISRQVSDSPDGGGAIRIVPDGVAQYPRAASTALPVVPGGRYTVSGWLKCATSRLVNLNVNWQNSGGTYLSAGGAGVNVVAGEWPWVEETITAPGTAAEAVIVPTVPSYPPSTDWLMGDLLTLRPYLAGSSPSDFPFDIRVGGEVMQVLGIEPRIMTLNPRLLAGTTGWGAQGGAALAVVTTPVHTDEGGTASLRVTPNGVASEGGATTSSSSTTADPIVVGDEYVCRGWVYSPAGAADIRANIDWASSGGYLSTSLGVVTPIPAATWTYVELKAVAPVGAVAASARARHVGAGTTVYYVWDMSVRPATVQTFTVRRSRNGIVKTHPLGADVRLAHPSLVAL
ncbi:carbohydrate binding domain-containing protein [Streptomyces sp. NPDC060194]|uniref:carbohydrate binding domain-containing protein n=1 Tax=Streptomyces sp. NPDC060194 TaxID=3347069 RepID=UPI003662CB7A